MRVVIKPLAWSLGLALTVVSCGSPPDAVVDAAKDAVDNAAANGAGEYAVASLRAAEEAEAALDAELAVQGRQWLPSYERVRSLAAVTKVAGDKAAKDAIAARETANAAVLTKIAAAGSDLRPAGVRVGGRLKPPIKIRDVSPVYPEIARSARIEGQVVVRATIGKHGRVVGAKVVRSVPMLDQAALDAVRQWAYVPTRLNGAPVPVTMTVRVNFTL